MPRGWWRLPRHPPDCWRREWKNDNGLVDVERGGTFSYFSGVCFLVPHSLRAISGGIQPLNHKKQKCKMFANNNHDGSRLPASSAAAPIYRTPCPASWVVSLHAASLCSAPLAGRQELTVPKKRSANPSNTGTCSVELLS